MNEIQKRRLIILSNKIKELSERIKDTKEYHDIAYEIINTILKNHGYSSIKSLMKDYVNPEKVEIVFSNDIYEVLKNKNSLDNYESIMEAFYDIFQEEQRK